MMQGIPIKWKITLLSLGVVLYSLLIGEIVFVGYILPVHEDDIGQRLLITARTVAQMPSVISRLSSPKSDISINNLVERIRVINDVDYIVVMDMNRRMLSFPLAQRIGMVSHTADENQAFVEHTYIDKAKGDHGVALRAFVPVMNEQNNTQIGVVLVGEILPSSWDVILGMRNQILMTFFLSLLFGVWGSWLLARHIKRQMLQLEPHEISRMLLERTATFHAMHEGIIAIDNFDRITIFNDMASKMLQIEEDVVGKPIRDAVSDDRFADILESSHVEYNRELRIGSDVILYTRVPIKLQEQIVGAVMMFQDRTEVTKLAEDLTGVRAFVEALRVQNHEFMNKLHTIAGLIQLDQKEKVLQYVLQITEQKEELTRFLSSRIHDDQLSGLLLAKINRGRELGIEVEIDRHSKIYSFPEGLDHHDFVALIGNLIENGFEAVEKAENKHILVSFAQDSSMLSILIEDTGYGMGQDVRARVFDRGFTTKAGVGRGNGLYLVKSIVDKGHGQIQVRSGEGEWTSFLILFPMTLAGED